MERERGDGEVGRMEKTETERGRVLRNNSVYDMAI